MNTNETAAEGDMKFLNNELKQINDQIITERQSIDDIISHRMMPKTPLYVIEQEQIVTKMQSKAPIKIHNMMTNQFFKSRTNKTTKTVTAVQNSNVKPSLEQNFQNLVHKYRPRIIAGSQLSSQKTQQCNHSPTRASDSASAERYLIKSIGSQIRSQTADLVQVNRQEFEPKFEFVSTGSQFDINNLQDKMKFYPNMGQRVKQQDFGIITNWIPQINQSSRNIVNKKMSVFSNDKTLQLQNLIRQTRQSADFSGMKQDLSFSDVPKMFNPRLSQSFMAEVQKSEKQQKTKSAPKLDAMIQEIATSNIKVKAPSQTKFNSFRHNEIKINAKLILKQVLRELKSEKNPSKINTLLEIKDFFSQISNFNKLDDSQIQVIEQLIQKYNGQVMIHLDKCDSQKSKSRVKYLEQLSQSKENIESFVYPSFIKNQKRNSQIYREVVQKVNGRTKIKHFQVNEPVNFPKGPNDIDLSQVSPGFQTDLHNKMASVDVFVKTPFEPKLFEKRGQTSQVLNRTYIVDKNNREFISKRDFKTTHRKGFEHMYQDAEVKSLHQKMIELKNLQKMKNIEKNRHRYAYEHVEKQELNTEIFLPVGNKSPESNREPLKDAQPSKRPQINTNFENLKSQRSCRKCDSPQKKGDLSKKDSLKDMIDLFLTDGLHLVEESPSPKSSVQSSSPYQRKFSIRQRLMSKQYSKEQMMILDKINEQKAMINNNRQEDMRKAKEQPFDPKELQFYEKLHEMMKKSRGASSMIDKQQMLEIVDKTMNTLHLIDINKEVHKQSRVLRFEEQIKATSDYIKDRRQKLLSESRYSK